MKGSFGIGGKASSSGVSHNKVAQGRGIDKAHHVNLMKAMGAKGPSDDDFVTPVQSNSCVKKSRIYERTGQLRHTKPVGDKGSSDEDFVTPSKKALRMTKSTGVSVQRKSVDEVINVTSTSSKKKSVSFRKPEVIDVRSTTPRKEIRSQKRSVIVIQGDTSEMAGKKNSRCSTSRGQQTGNAGDTGVQESDVQDASIENKEITYASSVEDCVSGMRSLYRKLVATTNDLKELMWAADYNYSDNPEVVQALDYIRDNITNDIQLRHFNIYTRNEEFEDIMESIREEVVHDLTTEFLNRKKDMNKRESEGPEAEDTDPDFHTPCKENADASITSPTVTQILESTDFQNYFDDLVLTELSARKKIVTKEASPMNNRDHCDVATSSMSLTRTEPTFMETERNAITGDDRANQMSSCSAVEIKFHTDEEIEQARVGEIIKKLERIKQDLGLKSQEWGAAVVDASELPDKENRKNEELREKRKVKPTHAVKSPYRSRIVNVKQARSPTEIAVSYWLFSGTGLEGDIIFKSPGGITLTRVLAESLNPGSDVHASVVDAWTVILNHDEQFRGPNTPRCVYCTVTQRANYSHDGHTLKSTRCPDTVKDEIKKKRYLAFKELVDRCLASSLFTNQYK